MALFGMHLEAKRCQIRLHGLLDFTEICRTIVQNHEIVTIPQVILTAQLLLHEVIEAVQINIGKELTGQIANGYTATSVQRNKEVHILRKILDNRFLRIAMIQNCFDEPAYAIIGNLPTQHVIEDIVVDTREVFENVTLEHIFVLAAKLGETINRPVCSLANSASV
jgi:hypothetical protein